jgi:hypothetical protein
MEDERKVASILSEATLVAATSSSLYVLSKDIFIDSGWISW